MLRLKWLAVLVMVFSLARPSIAGDLLPIVGTWRLVSFEREYQAGGEREYPMGKAPTGYILFLPEGRMTVVITGEGRTAPTTDQDRAWTETSGSQRWTCQRTPPGSARSRPALFGLTETDSKR
jgi:hypothetical protein